MTMWQALYLKELKDNQGIFIFLLLSTLCLGGYPLVVTTGAAKPSFWMVLAGVPYLMSLVFPFVLTHSFAQEFKGQTHYLLLSLPVPRWGIVLSKFAAVLTGSTALFVLATVFLHLLYRRLMVMVEHDPVAMFIYIEGIDLWILMASGYFSVTVLLLGIGTLIAGVKLLVRRFQGLIATGCFVACIYVYARLLIPTLEFLDFLGVYDLRIVERGFKGQEIQHVQPELQVLVYSCLMGLVFLGLGTWLVDRRVEV